MKRKKSLKPTYRGSRRMRQLMPTEVTLRINHLISINADRETAEIELGSIAEGDVYDRALRAFDQWMSLKVEVDR